MGSKRLVAALLACIFVLSACGPDEGYITTKEYRASYTNTVQTPMYTTTCSGNPVTCRQQLVGFTYNEVYHPECWKVNFRNDEGDNGSDCVTKDTYDTLNKGDHYVKES